MGIATVVEARLTWRESTTIKWEQGDDGIVILTLDDPNQSANTMNAAYAASMARDRRAARGREGRHQGRRPHLREEDLLRRRRPQRPQAGHAGERRRDRRASSARARTALRRLETLGVPVVAAINGAALGGGLEICLATHHRVIVDDPKAVVGFPEVQLGLLPGAGGVVRSVRMIGIVDALMQLLLQGKRLKPAKAKELGIVDEIVATREDLVPAAKAWIAAQGEDFAGQPWDQKGYKIPGGTPSNPKLAMNLPAFPANLRKQLKGANYPAPHHIMAVAVEGAQVDVDTAFEIEGRYFVDLVTGQISKNMIQAFFFDLQGSTATAAARRASSPTRPRRSSCSARA